jgi:hypothetical protein
LYLQWQLSQLQIGMGGQPTNTDPVTCAQLTGLLNATNSWLYSISQAITNVGSGTPTPIDLSGVITALTEIAVVGNSYAAVWTANATQLCACISSLSTVLSGATPVDLSHVNAAADLEVTDGALTAANLAAFDALLDASWALYGVQE